MTTSLFTKLPCTMRVLILLPLICAVFAAPDHTIRPHLASWRGGSRIFGGNDTTIQTYPYMSNMLYFNRDTWVSFCGGSLITPSTILSVAHCYYADLPIEWRVRLGSTFASSGGSVHTVLSFHIYENYDDEALTDNVAIVRLTTRVPLSDTIGLARIAGSNYHLSDGTELTAVGWGDQYGNYTFAETLQHVNVNIFNQDLCAERYDDVVPDLTFVTNGSLCTHNLDGRGACGGDDGSPVVHQGDIVVGLISWGYDCGHTFYPVINTRVSYFSDWIVVNGAG